MPRPMSIILANCSLFLGGCGTFSDALCGPLDEHAYYRGVRLDVAVVKEGGASTLMAADIPLSAVADTLLLPSIAYHELTDPPRKKLESSSDEPVTGIERQVDALPQRRIKE